MWNLISADIVMAARLLTDAGLTELAARLVGARLASGYAVGLSEVLSVLLQDRATTTLGDRYRPSSTRDGPGAPEAAARAIAGLDRTLGE
ncbi:MAG: hypothetical protein U5R31_06610 [Acidimicrobiia bacterium]|nr:hypothetical protein [Acidimicrobiia bacterium]